MEFNSTTVREHFKQARVMTRGYYENNKKSSEVYVALYATPNPFLLTRICLNQINNDYNTT